MAMTPLIDAISLVLATSFPVGLLSGQGLQRLASRAPGSKASLHITQLDSYIKYIKYISHVNGSR